MLQRRLFRIFVSISGFFLVLSWGGVDVRSPTGVVKDEGGRVGATRLHAHTHTHTCTHICVCVYLYVYIHKCPLAHIYTHYEHAHTYTHTHQQFCGRWAVAGARGGAEILKSQLATDFLMCNDNKADF